jgi:hypothetical protein
VKVVLYTELTNCNAELLTMTPPKYVTYCYPYNMSYTVCINYYGPELCFPDIFACGPLLASKNNQGSSHPCSVNTECLNDRYPKLKIYMILGTYEYIPVAYVKMHCMI